VARFQSLMNAGVRISAFIEDYTGISNDMVRAAPPAAEVMARSRAVRAGCATGGAQRLVRPTFLGGGTGQAGAGASDHPFACTMLLSRRLYPQAGSYRLGSLAAYHSIPSAGRAHRAMADAEVAAALLSRIRGDIQREYEVDDVPHDLLVKVQRSQRKSVPKAIQDYFQTVRELSS
jgi:DNA polymerase-3 subunit epsilon